MTEVERLAHLAGTPRSELVRHVPADPSCPECKAGKHRSCDGGAWDLDQDVPTHCRCWADGHGGTVGSSTGPVLTDAADSAEGQHYRHTRIGGDAA